MAEPRVREIEGSASCRCALDREIVRASYSQTVSRGYKTLPADRLQSTTGLNRAVQTRLGAILLAQGISNSGPEGRCGTS